MNAYTNPYRTYSNEAELDSYIALCGEAADLLEQLAEYVGDHGGVAPDAVDQNDVNRMYGIVARLRDAKQHSGIDG